MNRIARKLLSMLLTMALVFSGVPVFAQEAEACTHEHDAECGYIEGNDCTHEHEEDCGEDGADCIHAHDNECGYIEAVACEHEHNEDCGGLPEDDIPLEQSGSITGFEMVELAVEVGTAEEDIPFPGEVTAIVQPEIEDATPTTIAVGVNDWRIAYDSYDPAVEMLYVFQADIDTATLPEGVTVGLDEFGDTAVPYARVTVGDATMPEIMPFAATPNYGWYGDGSASSFTISTAEELLGFSNIVNGPVSGVTTAKVNFNGKTVTLDADIDLSSVCGAAVDGGTNWPRIGTGTTTTFQGTFDGNYHIVENLYINVTTNTYQGLFGIVNGATIKNLGVTGTVSSTGTQAVGGIVGYSAGSASTIEQCYSTVTVSGTGSGTGVGGIAGNSGGTIKDCFSTGNISGGSNNTGGIVGKMETGSVTTSNCYSTGTVTASTGTVGGIVGENLAGTVKNCIALGSSVTTTGTTANRVVGNSNGTTLSGLKARSNMTVNGETVTGGQADNENGADVPFDSSVALSSVFESGAFGDGTGIWTFTGTDKMSDGVTLPILTGFAGGGGGGDTYTAAISPTSHTFTAQAVGYSSVTAQQFTISNTGTGALSNVAASLTTDTNFTISTGLSSNSIAASGSATVSVKPNDGLTEGTYTDTLTISGDNGLNITASVSFTVSTETFYALTVTSGSGSGNYAAGSSVTITADSAPAGQVFDKWTGGNGGSFANANSASTTFTMPANAATITANFTNVPPAPTNAPVVPTAQPDPTTEPSAEPTALPTAVSTEPPTTAPTPAPTSTPEPTGTVPVEIEAPVEATVNQDGQLDVTLDEKKADELIKQAQAVAAHEGANAGEIEIVLNVANTSGLSVDSSQFNLSAEVLKKFIDAGVTKMTVSTGDFIYTFEPSTIPTSGGGATIVAIPSEAPEAAKEQIGDRPVWYVTLQHVTNKAMKSAVTGENLRFQAKYTPKKGETRGKLCVVRINEDGATVPVKDSYYHDGYMVWMGQVNNTYGVGYMPHEVRYSDIDEHWAHHGIDYAIARSLVSGLKKNKYEPNKLMLRSEISAAFAELLGIQEIPFDKPSTSLSRQALADYIVKCFKAAGEPLPELRDAQKFSDTSSKNVAVVQKAGLMTFYTDGQFMPKKSVLRGELAEILRRAAGLITNPKSVYGWACNDSGAKQYYDASGKLAIGWQKLEKKTYYFDKSGSMLNGFQVIDGDTYYFGDPYYVGGSKGMTVNQWKEIGGDWYYFYKDGKMAKDTTIDGYKIGPDGKRIKK